MVDWARWRYASREQKNNKEIAQYQLNVCKRQAFAIAFAPSAVAMKLSHGTVHSHHFFWNVILHSLCRSRTIPENMLTPVHSDRANFFCLFNVDADVVCSAKGRYSAFLAGHTKPFELMTFEIHSQQHVVAEYFRFSILANFNVSMFRRPNTLCGWSMMDSVETLREELPDIHETGYNHCIKVKINWWCEVRSRVHRTCDWKRTTMPSYRIMRIFLICRSSRV